MILLHLSEFFSVLFNNVIWRLIKNSRATECNGRKQVCMIILERSFQYWLEDGENFNDGEITFMDKKVACQYPLMSERRFSVKLMFGKFLPI